MAGYINTVLTNIGEPINIEIEIFPATSFNDDVIIIKREKWPENADLGQVIYWLFGCIFTESKRYNLAPKGVIMVEYLMKPFGNFQYEDDNIKGLCNIPWDAVIAFVGNSGQDLSNQKQFANAWECVNLH